MLASLEYVTPGEENSSTVTSIVLCCIVSMNGRNPVSQRQHVTSGSFVVIVRVGLSWI